MAMFHLHYVLDSKRQVICDIRYHVVSVANSRKKVGTVDE